MITSDIWAYLEYLSRKNLARPDAKQAVSYVNQALEFYEAAENPRIPSRPLLYYYCFLNLAKVFLLHKGNSLPSRMQHGITDPASNVTPKPRFEGQEVRCFGLDDSGENLFPRFFVALGGQKSRLPRTYSVVELLRQVPVIHRTYCSVLKSSPQFCPAEEIEVVSASDQFWVRLRFNPKDRDVRATLPSIKKSLKFKSSFRAIESLDSDGIWFESETEAGKKKGVTSAIARLQQRIQSCGLWAILTTKGYKSYFAVFPPIQAMPQLASAYAAMFYLGSITRYRPDFFDKVITRGPAWLLSEFLNLQPIQFAYILAGSLSGTEVVYPLFSAPQ